jgi:hypothetical protein
MAREVEDIAQFAPHLAADVVAHAETEGQEAFLAEAFTDLVLDDLEQEGFWPDYQLAYWSQRGVELSAWGLDETNKTLYLCVTDFAYSDEVRTMSRSDQAARYKRVINFLERALSGTIDVQDHNPVLDVVTTIEGKQAYDVVNVCLLTNRQIRPAEEPATSIDGVEVHFRTWDLEAIRRLRQSGVQLEPIEVDFIARFGAGIPCLRSTQSTLNVETLLAFVPGAYLANVYLEFGPRLLERNVRSFLMARGKINQGIRDTLRYDPDRFLAYNNGITATASKVDLEYDINGSPVISRIYELQIVNGGQTTASIAMASRDSEVDLSQVAVQMKLAVVDSSLLDDLVPNISRFANRQNAVSDSDLAANNDFLRNLQMVSRTEWTPISGHGSASKWYFERARGSYAVEKSEAGSPSKQAQFTAIYPPAQKFGKNELALYENTWNCLPYFVCRGGQKNFAEYVDRLQREELDSDSQDFFRQVFRDLVAKAILFHTADKIVHKNLTGTYKRAVVSYTLSYLLTKAKQKPDLSLIWRSQEVDESIQMAISDIAPPLKEFLISSAAGRNITEWAKHKACWEEMESQNFPFVLATEETSDGSHKPNHARRNAAAESNDEGPRELRTLAAAIESVFGEPIEGSWKRYRRKKWWYAGETSTPAPSGRDTLHLFQGEFRNSQDEPYTLVVAVDFPGRAIIPLDTPGELPQIIDDWMKSSR